MQEKLNKNSRLGYYLIIPSFIFNNSNLSNTSKLLYGLISGLCSEQGHCYAQNSYLAEKMNCSLSTITRSIQELITNELIYITIENNNVRKIYLRLTTTQKIARLLSK